MYMGNDEEPGMPWSSGRLRGLRIGLGQSSQDWEDLDWFLAQLGWEVTDEYLF